MDDRDSSKNRKLCCEIFHPSPLGREGGNGESAGGRHEKYHARPPFSDVKTSLSMSRRAATATARESMGKGLGRPRPE